MLIGVVVLVLIAAACGGNGNSGSSGASDGHDGHEMGSMEGSMMGEPADEADADRTINVVMLDELAYDPAELQVDKGEVVTFAVVNEGEARHEFVLGDEDFQDSHEADMADGAHNEAMSNGLSLEPGASGSLTWRFTESGEVLYGCHEPGHYEGGMVGAVEVR